MKVIEKEWNNYLMNALPKDASVLQVTETQKAFYAGAAFLFYAILNFIDEDREPTEADLEKMDALNKEIDQWLEKGQHLV